MHRFKVAGFKQFIFIPSDFTVLLTSPEAATWVVLYKKLLLKFLQYSQENTSVEVPFIKRRFQHMFSCEYCKMFKDTYFEELRMAALTSHTKVSPLSPAGRFPPLGSTWGSWVPGPTLRPWVLLSCYVQVWFIFPIFY